MARVFRARARDADGTERAVVIKRLRDHLAADPIAVRRFVNEGLLHSHVRHPNVVSIHEVGYDDRGPFIVLAWIDGTSLRALADAARQRGVRLATAVGTRVVVDALRGLHAAHVATDDEGHPLGILHRDATPDNILVGRDGVARIIDFGVAKCTGGQRLTDPGMVVGKLHYLAPEYLDRRPVDARMDVYAMGMTAWVALAGRKPFGNERGVAVDLATREVPDLGACSDVPKSIADVVHRACRLDPNERFSSAGVMAEALEEAARESLALATHADVADAVAAVLRPDEVSGTRSVRPRMDMSSPAWERLGMDEHVWREEVPTGREPSLAERLRDKTRTA